MNTVLSPQSETFSHRLSLKGQRWLFVPSGSDHFVQQLCQVLDLPPFLSRILSVRTHSVDEARAFLSPSLRAHLPAPFDLPGMDNLVRCLVEATLQRKKMAIWGDYDVDGATSAALWVRFFRQLGISVQTYIPHRMDEGYGPNKAGLKTLRDVGISTVVIVDCGTTAFEALAYAQSIGLEVIVVDHHLPEATLPLCSALVNPKRPDADVTAKVFEDCAAVGVSFFCLVALRQALREKGFFNKVPEPLLIDLLDLVALGTVCDVMPLVGVNRLFVKKGLEVMNKQPNLGLRALADRAEIQSTLMAYHLGFVLGPRINAGGRLGESDLGVRLLSTDHALEASELAASLHFLNQKRQVVEKSVLEEALIQAEDQKDQAVLYVGGKDWHEGVVGIIASRLKDRYHKPVFVVSWSDQEGKGSARSIPGIDLGRIIHQGVQSEILLKGGGHQMAGGFSLERSQEKAFHHFLNTKMAKALTKGAFDRELFIHTPLTFSAVTDDALSKLKILEPFGVGNPKPLFAFLDVSVGFVQPVGDGHLRLTLQESGGGNCEAIAFRVKDTALGDFLSSSSGRRFHVAGHIDRNLYGKRQIVVEDVLLS
jgi:single-stranded-DNA-specific exonuclease